VANEDTDTLNEMRWLPFATVCVLGAIYFYFDRDSVKRKGHVLLTSTSARVAFFFCFWFLAFSTLGFAQGKSMVRVIVVSAITGAVMAALFRWRWSRTKT
jgi:NADH:ubiquinone oxidoreductase subunit 6 (subunit J)